jgi:hypothetical protein
MPGPAGNDIHMTNVPYIRLQYRLETLNAELALIEEGCNPPPQHARQPSFAIRSAAYGSTAGANAGSVAATVAAAVASGMPVPARDAAGLTGHSNDRPAPAVVVPASTLAGGAMANLSLGPPNPASSGGAAAASAGGYEGTTYTLQGSGAAGGAAAAAARPSSNTLATSAGSEGSVGLAGGDVGGAGSGMNVAADPRHRAFVAAQVAAAAALQSDFHH